MPSAPRFVRVTPFRPDKGSEHRLPHDLTAFRDALQVFSAPLRKPARRYAYRGLKIFTSLALRFQDFQRMKRIGKIYVELVSKGLCWLLRKAIELNKAPCIMGRFLTACRLGWASKPFMPLGATQLTLAHLLVCHLEENNETKRSSWF